MKRLLIAAILAGFALLCACAPTENAPAGSPSPDASAPPAIVASAAPAPEVTNDMAVPSGEVQAIEETREHVEAMLPILDSLVRTMGIAGDTEYAPEDSEFFWTVLYLMGNNWGPTHPFVEAGDDGVTTVPARVMEEFAGAAFAAYSAFPSIPEDLQGSVTFDEASEAYVLSPSDMGGTITKLDDVSLGQDGGVTATVGLYDGTDNPEDFMGSVVFTLVKHPNAEGISDSIYLYRVTGATKRPKA